jgi:medium-chain acyl-[acyl-carrier-protein] hydrolase
MVEEPFLNMSSLVDAVTEALLPHIYTRYAFFGHSMGALISYEVARRLRLMGKDGPSILIASACRAPHLPREGKATYTMSDAELIDELKMWKGTPNAVLENFELMQLLLPIVRADLKVIETYVYTEQEAVLLDCPIAVFGGCEDRYVQRDELDAWRSQTLRGFSCRIMDGNHFFPFTSSEKMIPLIVASVRSADRQRVPLSDVEERSFSP